MAAELAGLDPRVAAAALGCFNAIAGARRTLADRAALLSRLGGAAIGEKLAPVVVAMGPVGAITDLLAVRGLGEKRLISMATALAAAPAEELAALAAAAEAVDRASALAIQVSALEAERDALRVERDGLAARLDAASASASATTTVTASDGATASAPTVKSGVVSLHAIATSTGEQLGRAHRELSTRKQGLRLSGLSLSLRGEAGVDEEQALGLALDQPTAAASELKMAWALPSGGAPTATAGRVPDVSGYTEALARRKLEAAGYTVSLRQTSAAGPAERGRVQRQRPAPGAEADPGDRVEIVVAR